MFSKISKLCLLLGFLSGFYAAAQFEIEIATHDNAPNVVLSWNSHPSATGYNLYRKLQTDTSWPVNPINGAPIAMAADCAALQQILGLNSPSWLLLEEGLADDTNPVFDPCWLINTTLSAEQEKRLDMIASIDWKVAAALGLAFEDDTVTNGEAYHYEIRATDASDNEIGMLASNLAIVAGKPIDLPAPTNLAAQAGDSAVLLTWDPTPGAAGFIIYRRKGTGPWQQINQTPYLTTIAEDLNNNPINSAGYLDQMVWDQNGDPDGHEVNGIFIDGPFNSITYDYRVTSINLLAYESKLQSDIVSGQPMDSTPPKVPNSVQVTALENALPNGALEVSWAVVTRDVQNHPETVDAYQLYRYADANDSGTLIATVPAPSPGIIVMTAADNDPGLRSEFGEKTWTYRVKAVDMENNESGFSAGAGGYLADTTPPAPPQSLDSEGFDEHIFISWVLGSEPDLDGYQIYRSICDSGTWDPIDGVSPWVLIGELSYDQAVVHAAGDSFTWFEDHTVPAGSPLCYGYLIKAKDTSQNTSGDWPPNFAIEEMVCQNLRDRTGPDPAAITALDARDNAVSIQWVAPPIQDVKAYHIYRSQQPNSGYIWLGGVFVAPPNQPPILMTQPFTGNFSGCTDIPAVSQPYMGKGSFLDQDVIPKQEYHYKVLGVDVHGNESDINSAIPVSTFTYSALQSAAPQITDMVAGTNPCTLTLSWSPTFAPSLHTGFAVYRQEAGSVHFQHVGDLITGNQYVDDTVVAGKQYNYQVVLLNGEGKVSPPSAVQSATVPQ